MSKIIGESEGTIIIEIEGTIFKIEDVETLKYQIQSRIGQIADNVKFDTERFAQFGIKINASGNLKNLEGLQRMYQAISERLLVVFKNSKLKITVKYTERQG